MSIKQSVLVLLIGTTLVGCNNNSDKEEPSNESGAEPIKVKITFEEFQAQVLSTIPDTGLYVDCGVSQIDQDVDEVQKCIESSFYDAKPFYGFDKFVGVDTLLGAASILNENGTVTNWYYDKHCLFGAAECNSFVESVTCENPGLRSIDEIQEKELMMQFRDRFFECSNSSQ
ncbi:hypothetical protein BA893_07120 [Vibrio natriegens]|uniref:hypothetical protein n=1 Tax=Vibrio natriegens TaxID=691 RepID=UPI0008043B5D|nr:hypothetical protein [Vibrio natriegens]ANQ21450.1 hypothetical protein BA893_07120 [Vibrio natriegens]CAH0529166.1 hypothetical protein CTH30272_02478 [Catenococcus thiocycli]